MALPVEIDFEKDRSATPKRMNVAMQYLDARFRALEAIQPEYQSVIDQLRGVGLERITEVLTPLFTDAAQTKAAIDAFLDSLQADSTVEDLTGAVTQAVVSAFADYRHRYQGALDEAPEVREDGTPVAVGDMYFDTGLDQMRVLASTGWKNAGSSVAGIMEQIAPIVATSGQTVFTIPGGYEVGYLILTANGVVIPAPDYTATNGSTVTLAVGLAAGVKLAGVKFGSVTLASVYDKAAADARFRTIADSYTKSQVDSAIAGRAPAGSSYTKSESDERHLKVDMSNLPDAAAARNSLGVGTAGTRAETLFLRLDSSLTGAKVTRSSSAPSSPSAGDIWLQPA